MINTAIHRVAPGMPVDVSRIPTSYDAGLTRERGEAQFRKLRRRLVKLQEKLYADGGQALLVVFQAMDAGGKDSTIRNVFGPVNPQGCHVASFKAPSTLERSHDFLWRIHQQAPARGMIGVFNRSHYEDVLIVRVKGLAPERVWRPRYEHINAFERQLHADGTRVVKFFLHISKDYQKVRLQRRLDRPDKHWKFNPDDLAERARWDDYQQAFSEALERCSTEDAPWYVVPAENRWYRNLLVTRVLVQTLQSMELKWPTADFNPKQIVVE